MLKCKLNLILQFVSYEVIMSRNIFLDHSPLFCPHMEFFISPLVLTLLNIMEWLSARTIIWLKQLALLLHHKVPQHFWGDATLATSYLINPMSSSVLHDKILHSILFPNQPLFCLPPRVFSCICFVHILTLGQDKLSAKITKCVFLDYSRLQRGYLCYFPDTHRYFISTDVTFFENSSMFPINYPPNSDVISLPLIYLVPDTSLVPPITPPRPLQVYTRRPCIDTEPPADSSPMAPSSTKSVLPSPVDLPNVIRKGTRSSCNPHPFFFFFFDRQAEKKKFH